jgi:hypothetical protein
MFCIECSSYTLNIGFILEDATHVIRLDTIFLLGNFIKRKTFIASELSRLGQLRLLYLMERSGRFVLSYNFLSYRKALIINSALMTFLAPTSLDPSVSYFIHQ